MCAMCEWGGGGEEVEAGAERAVRVAWPREETICIRDRTVGRELTVPHSLLVLAPELERSWRGAILWVKFS